MFINQNKSFKSKYFMRLALLQAQKVLGNTKTNPAVGCVLVKNQNVISAGSTGINGRPHAEVNTLNFSKVNVYKSDLYSTLEPCSHYGKTPPCVKAIIKNKINKVFFSVNDPDYRSFKKSFNILKKNSIKVNKGILKKEVSDFYRSYINYKKKSLFPFVTCKLAVSKDFYTIDTRSRWITNKFSRGRVHLMRANHDCIITTSKTINTDNSLLTCRVNGLYSRSPSRIILDSKLKVNINSKIFKEAKKFKTIIFYNKIDKKKINTLKKHNVKLYKVNINKDGSFNLKDLLTKVKKLNFSRIMIESGIHLIKNLLKNNLINEFKIFISKKNLTNKGRGNAKFLIKLLKNKRKVIEKVNLFDDKLFSYKIK